MKGFLSWLTRGFAWGVLYGCVVIFLDFYISPKQRSTQGRRAKVQVALLHYRRDLVSRQTVGWDDFGGVLHFGAMKKGTLVV